VYFTAWILIWLGVGFVGSCGFGFFFCCCCCCKPCRKKADDLKKVHDVNENKNLPDDEYGDEIPPTQPNAPNIDRNAHDHEDDIKLQDMDRSEEDDISASNMDLKKQGMPHLSAARDTS
jgi:hypothetical protein